MQVGRQAASASLGVGVMPPIAIQAMRRAGDSMIAGYDPRYATSRAMPRSTIIPCHVLRQLSLIAPSAPKRPAHLAAASGLVHVGGWLYVVADDELQLGVFRFGADEPGTLLRMFAGDLPNGPGARKKAKPDLESLVLLPPDPHWPHGALLALPSASRPNRNRGALLTLDVQGAPDGAARIIDLSGFFALLRESIPASNIEGATIVGTELVLFQRGNKAAAASACLRFDYAAFAIGLANGAVGAMALTRVDLLDLGSIDGIPLAFSDACALPDGRIAFCAVAEDTDDPYLDGAFCGAAIGMLDANGALASLRRIDAPAKIEGISARRVDDIIELLLVTDADDAAAAGLLLEARID